MRALILLCFVVAAFAWPGPLRAQPACLSYGVPVEGSLTAAQPGILYVFAAQQGDVISLTATVVDGAFDPFLILLDSAQRQVLAVAGRAEGSNAAFARLRYVILTSGDYLVRVAARSGEGRFRLSLDRLNPTPSPFASAPRLSLIRDRIQAELSEAVRFHLYALHARAGEPLRFALEAGGELQAGMYLYDSALARRLGGAELGQPLEIVPPAEGLYFLVVAHIGGSGTYTLRKLSTVGSPAAMAVSEGAILVPGQAQVGEVGARLGVVYRFEGRTGTQIRADVDSADGVEVVVILADSAFRQIAAGNGGISDVALPHDGVYTLILATRKGPNDTAGGAYALTLQSLAPAPTSTPPPNRTIIPITYGSSVSGEITETQPLYYYGFQGAQGDVVTIRVTGGVVIYLYRYQDDQPTLLASTASGEISRVRLPASSPYLIVLARGSGGQGQFALTLNHDGG